MSLLDSCYDVFQRVGRERRKDALQITKRLIDLEMMIINNEEYLLQV